MMVPDKYRRMLWERGTFDTRMDVHRWIEETAGKLSKVAEPYPGQVHVEMVEGSSMVLEGA